MSLKIIKDIKEIKNIAALEKNLGFVPTMGSLHEGHLTLIRRAQQETDKVIVSLFVNPTQFDNPQDFAMYPSKRAEDLELLEKLNVDYVFIPEPEMIYPNGFSYKIHEEKDSLGLCGTARPGHFSGVLTVLMKLFNLIKPKKVFMGLKDYQQWKLVDGMVKDFFMDIEIVGVDTVRDEEGLALSSRNFNLTDAQILTARQFANILKQPISLDDVKQKLKDLGIKVDYLEVRWNRRFAAVFIGTVRLIDNVPDPLLEKQEQKDNQNQSPQNIIHSDDYMEGAELNG